MAQAGSPYIRPEFIRYIHDTGRQPSRTARVEERVALVERCVSNDRGEFEREADESSPRDVDSQFTCAV